MTRIRNAAEGVWDFIVGDDWVTAAGVVAALAITALMGDSAWFVMPLAVVILMTLSIWREARKLRRD